MLNVPHLKRLANIKGITYMVINALGLASLYATMKIVTQDIDASCAIFLYKACILFLALPYLFVVEGWQLMKTPSLKLHIIRSFFSTAGAICLMASLKYINLVDVTTLARVEQLLWVLMGFAFFNEALSKTKISMVIVGFLGAIIIVNPGLFTTSFTDTTTSINPAYILVAGAVLFWTVNSMIIKLMGSRNVKNSTQLFYVTIFSIIFSAFVAFLRFDFNSFGYNNIIPINIDLTSIHKLQVLHLKYLLLCALFYLIHCTCFFYSLKHGELSLVAPFVYFELIFAGLLGFFIFGEYPSSPISYLGYILIVAAGIVTTRKSMRSNTAKQG